MNSDLHLQDLRVSDTFAIRRSGRFLIAELLTPHRVLSTSALSGGEQESIKYLVNHQSCEATGHLDLHEKISAVGQQGYHREVCESLGLPPERTAVMGTAASMNYAAVRVEKFGDASACAAVTAGVHGNATRAADPAIWQETEQRWQPVTPHSGTINTILIVDCPLAPGALARAVVTMTEGKSAALAELAIGSRSSQHLATGTGTDQFAIATPLDPGRKPRESTSPHSKLGELIGRAVLEATKEALRWQNGLEPSYTRGVVEALGRFGLTLEGIRESIKAELSADDFELFAKNEKSALYDPQVGAACYAFAAVVDRIEYGAIPPGLASETLRQQAANIAVSIAAKPWEWPRFFDELTVDEADPLAVVPRAIALGWKTKWT